MKLQLLVSTPRGRGLSMCISSKVQGEPWATL